MSLTDLSQHLTDAELNDAFEAAGLRHGLPVLGHGTPDVSLLRPRAERVGNCYSMSLAWVVDAEKRLTPPQRREVRAQLVHGSIQGHGWPRIGHAWVTWRDPSTNVRMAADVVHAIHGTKEAFDTFTGATEYRTYSPMAAVRLADANDHSGPWHALPFGNDDCPHGYYPDDTCPYPDVCPGAA